jgi:hypothetical protein
MPEFPPGLSSKPPWRIRADGLREQLQRIPRLGEAIESLSRWFGVLRGGPYDTRPADERLCAAFTSQTGNPVAWCAGVPAYLSPDLETLLGVSVGPDAQVETLDPLIRYALGRACMKSIMARPSDTSGLSLAYSLLWPVSHDGIGYAGADDELLDQLASATEARVEIEAEARRLGENPVSAASGFDHDRNAQFIERASKPVSLEACTHWQVQSLHFDLKFGRVIQVIASSETAFASELLETVGNAALVASFLRGSGIQDITTLANLLKSVGPAFDQNYLWTGSSMAWMILLDIEERLLKLLQAQIQVARLGAGRPPDPGAIVKREVALTVDVLLSRKDGARLALEWLSHLLWSVILLRTPPPRVGEDDLSIFEPRQVLLQVVSIRLGREDWANPLRIWTLFGGSLLVAGVNDSYRPYRKVPLLLPLWRDWLGQPNTIVPLAVAVQLWGFAVASPGWLAEWVRHLCRDLEGHPAIHQLVKAEPSEAAKYLAWPLVRSGRVSEKFGEIWSDAGWQLTKARFAKLENSADVVQPCAALLCVGLQMLEWSVRDSADDAGALAALLATAIDEVRYTLPEIGIIPWSTFVGRLAGVMASAGLLKYGGCEQLLARYDGDDESLAFAAVYAVANGVPAAEVKQALVSIGVDARELAQRWNTWNARFERGDNGKPSSFLAYLQAISEAVS